MRSDHLSARVRLILPSSDGVIPRLTSFCDFDGEIIIPPKGESGRKSR